MLNFYSSIVPVIIPTIVPVIMQQMNSVSVFQRISCNLIMYLYVCFYLVTEF